MVGHGGSSAGSYLADPTSPIPSHCASIVATSSLKSLRLEIIIEKTMWYTEMRNENESQEFCIDFVLL